MQPIGYGVQQHSVRLSRPVKAFDRWVSRIPAEYRTTILDAPAPPADLRTADDPICLATLKHYRSLVPMGQEARKPIFHLTVADGAIGNHALAVKVLPSADRRPRIALCSLPMCLRWMASSRQMEAELLSTTPSDLRAIRRRLNLSQGNALSYFLDEDDAPIGYLRDGRFEIDSNRKCNPAHRGGRRRLFSGHPDAGWRTAVAYTILASCRRRHINPEAYLTDVLRRLPTLKITEISSLLPANWTPVSGVAAP